MTLITDCYVSLEEIKQRLGGNVATSEDAPLTTAVTSACRAIDMHCLQSFTTDTSATAKLWIPTDACEILIDPFWDLTGLVIKTDTGDDAGFATTWTSADYELVVFGGGWGQSIGAPYDTIRAVGSNVFPVGNRRVQSLQVTAKWGWAATPQNVTEAARILSVDLWKRKDVPFGISTGTVDFGGLRIGRDSLAQVEPLIRRFVRGDRAFGFGG